MAEENSHKEPSFMLFLHALLYSIYTMGFPDGSAVKNLPAVQETQKTQLQSLDQKDPLEE